jgi:hypothetical protein
LGRKKCTDISRTNPTGFGNSFGKNTSLLDRRGSDMISNALYPIDNLVMVVI